MPAASLFDVAAISVASRLSIVVGVWDWTVQAAGFVAAVTASAKACCGADARIALVSVAGSAGTVIAFGSKYWQARLAGSATVCHAPGYATRATDAPAGFLRSQNAAVGGIEGGGLGGAADAGGAGAGALGCGSGDGAISGVGRRSATFSEPPRSVRFTWLFRVSINEAPS